MAQLNDTMVQGDLRVTGKIYGTENAIRRDNANLAIPTLGAGDNVGSTGDFFIGSGSGKNLPDTTNNFNIHTTVTHLTGTTYRLSQIATPTSSTNPSGIYERGGSSTDGVTWTFGSWVSTTTDTKVTQTKDDSGTTAYPLLMAGAADPNGTATTSRYDSGVTLTPSTNTISANISGNAATASAAQSGSALETAINGKSPATHTHGNIASGGTLTDTAAAAAGNDYVVIRDADNAKIQTSTIKGTDVADAVSKKHSHSTLTLSTTAQAYDGTHTLALPSTDPYTSARTPASHTHGNITNGGALQTNDVAIANGDKLVVTDASDSSKVARTSVSFDGSTTTKALTPKGTFEAFAKSGDITTAIQALDVSSVGGDGKYISAISETDGKISATATTMDTTPTESSTNAVTSGGIKTALDGKSSTSHTHTTSIASDSSSGTVVTLAHNTQYKLTAGGTSVLFKTPADNNTDTKVTQTVDTTNDAAFPLLAKNTTATATITDTSRFTSGVTLNPKNKSLTATTFIGALSGNATTATSLYKTGISYHRPSGDAKQWCRLATLTEANIASGGLWYGVGVVVNLYANPYGIATRQTHFGTYELVFRIGISAGSGYSLKTSGEMGIRRLHGPDRIAAADGKSGIDWKIVRSDTKVEFFIKNSEWDSALYIEKVQEINGAGTRWVWKVENGLYTDDEFATYCSDKTTVDDTICRTYKSNALVCSRESSFNYNNWTQQRGLIMAEADPTGATNAPSANNWFYLLSMQGGDAAYAGQMAFRMTGDPGLFIRQRKASAWGSWSRLLTTGDVTSTYSATGTSPVNGTAVASAISDVVHKTGTETITGVKTFNNAVSPRQTGDSFAKQSKVFDCSVITPYADWTAAQKDGNHYRAWTIDLTPVIVTSSTHGNIIVKMIGSWYNTPSNGALQREITFQIHSGNVVISNGDYTVAQSPCADEFAISDVIKSGNDYLVQVVNRNPTANNYPLRLEIDMFNKYNSAVLDDVTMTESITEGLPSWAAGVAQVTASGSPVFTESSLAFDGTYNASTNKAATVSTVTNAVSGKEPTNTVRISTTSAAIIKIDNTNNTRYSNYLISCGYPSGYNQGTYLLNGYDELTGIRSRLVQLIKCNSITGIYKDTNAVYFQFNAGTSFAVRALTSTELPTLSTVNSIPSTATAFAFTSIIDGDETVVHKAGSETITGQKVFKNNWPLMSSETQIYTYEKPLRLESGDNYADWTSAQKDGNHFRRWRIKFSSLNATYFVMRLKVIPGYYYENSTGCLEKMLVCRPNGTGGFPGGSSSSYTIAAGYAPDEYRINSVTYASDLNGYVIEVVSCKPMSNNSAGVILEVINLGTNSTQHAVPEITVVQDIIEGWPSWAGDKNTAPIIQSNGMDVIRVGDIATEAKRVHAVWHYWNTSSTTKWYNVLSVSQDGGNSSGYAGDMYAVTIRDSADNNCQCILTICGNSGGYVLDARLFAVKARTGNWASTKIYLYRQDDSHYTIYAKLERYGGIKIAPIVCQGTITYGTNVYDNQPFGTVEVDDRVQAFNYEVVTGSVPSNPSVGKFYLIS